VDHAVGVGGLDGPGQGLDQLRRRPHRLGPPLEVLGQAAAGYELQDEVRPARGLADVVNLDDVGVLQAGDRRGLGAKAGQALRAGLGPGQHHLQRHGAIEAELPGLVDHAHAAASQLPQDLVARHRRPVAGQPGTKCRPAPTGPPSLKPGRPREPGTRKKIDGTRR
jgi:hypothetical protein